MKKTLAILLALAMVFSTVTVAFAEGGIGTDAQSCVTLGMLEGNTSAGVTADYLVTTPTRIQAALLFLRLKGLEDKALEFTGTDNFADANQVKWDGYKAVMAYLKANPELGFKGIGNDKFDPNGLMTASSYYKVVLTALGYKQTETDVVGDFLWADVLKFAEEKGLKNVKDVTNFTVNDLAIATIEGLKATVKDSTKTLAAALIDVKAITEEQAIAAGVYAVPVVATLDIKSAVAINSKVIEVKLNTAATAVDAGNITVKDAAGTALVVASAELAAYDTDSKTVLVTLASDTTVGTLYTITSGTTSVNFGGKAVDTTKPELASTNAVVSTEYNEVTVTFNEPVQLNGATFTLAEKYGTKAALAISNVAYGDSNKEIVLTTAEQKGATLYSVVVDGAVDFAGNKMDKDDSNTFVGTAKKTDAVEVVAAAANSADEVTVELNVNVDPTTINAAAFKVEESYGTKAAVAVTEARLATDDDYAIDGVTALTTTTCKKFVVLTVPGLKNATLYKVTVSGLKSAYGKDMSTDSVDTYKTFVGKAKPTTVFGFAATPVSVSSNTEITISFERKVDATLAADIANYSIVEAYGTKAALAVTAADVDGTDVTLTVAPMKNILYKLTVSNLKDIYGNAIDTDSSANVTSFAGKPVAAKITSVTINRTDAAITDANTQIALVFDQNVGATATDVSHYVIDNGVGYPEKAAIVSGAGNEKKVILTIGKTNEGKVYKLTVKGLENADGIAMDADGVEKTFAGKGTSATIPQIEAVMATDNQTIKVFFDRDVTGSSIKGKIYSGTALVDGVLSYKTSAAASYTDLEDLTEYVYQDPDNANVLIIRVTTAAFDTSVSNTFDFKANKFVDTDYDEMPFAGNAADPSNPEIAAAMALDQNTLVVYFSESVADLTGNADTYFSINTKEDGSGTAVTVAAQAPYKVDSKTYRIKTGNMSNITYYLKVAEVSGNDADETVDKITDKTGAIELASTSDSTSAADYAAVQFGGSNTAASAITDIAVMMTDDRTIEVYYPEAMFADDPTDTNNASNPANYEIYYNDGDNKTGVQPVAALWDGDNNKVTLVLNAALTGSANNTYYLAIDGESTNGVKNATLTTGVKEDRTDLAGTNTKGVIRQFALASTENAKPEISSVTMNADNTKININFSEPVAFGNPAGVAYQTGVTAVGLNEFGVDGSSYTYGDTLTFGNYFTLTATDINDGAAVVTSAVRYDSDTVQVTLAKALKAGTNATVSVKAGLAATATVFNMNKTAIETASDKVQDFEFGVTSVVNDNIAPTVVSAEFTDATTLVVTFNEAVNAVAGDFTEGAVTPAGTATSYTISAIAGSGTNIITLTVAGNTTLVSGDTALVDIAGTVTDLAGNAITPVTGYTVTGF